MGDSPLRTVPHRTVPMMPIHPALVHFPIAFYFLELLLLLFWLGKKDPTYLRFARFSFHLGYVMMIVAMAGGLFDTKGFSGITGRVRIHVYSALVVFGIYTTRIGVSRFADRRNEQPVASPMIHIAAAILGNLAVIVTGYLGGKLVY